MSEVDIPALNTDPLIDWYVSLLDHLEQSLRKSVDNLKFLANRSPELILHLPMKPTTYVPGISELQEVYRKRYPVNIKKIVQSDPEIIAVLQWWYSFDQSKPELQRIIVGCGKEISRRISRATWGGDDSIDPFLDLEHMLAGHVVGDNLYGGIAAARKQARRFQNSCTQTNNIGPDKNVDAALSQQNIPSATRIAYNQYRETITANPSLANASMKEVYREVDRAAKIAGVELPSFETWARYVRDGKAKFESDSEKAD